MDTLSMHFGPIVTLVSEGTSSPDMFRAFALVDPTSWGMRDWKEPVSAVVHPDDLAAAGVTLEQVKDAVAFYTATEATVREAKTAVPGVTAYIVTAIGYRNGPAN